MPEEKATAWGTPQRSATASLEAAHRRSLGEPVPLRAPPRPRPCPRRRGSASSRGSPASRTVAGSSVVRVDTLAPAGAAIGAAPPTPMTDRLRERTEPRAEGQDGARHRRHRLVRQGVRRAPARRRTSRARSGVFSRDELKQSEMRRRVRDDERLRFLIGDVRDRERLRARDPRRRRDRPRGGAEAGAGVRVQPVRGRPDEHHRRRERRHGGDRATTCPQTVALSTDKAVNPVNLYGATKLCAEKIVAQGNAYAGDADARFASRPLRQRRRQPRQRHPAVPAPGARRACSRSPTSAMTRFWITLDAGGRLRPRAASSGCRAARSSCRKIPSMRVIDLAEALAPGRRAARSSASGPARSCTRCCSPRTRRATRCASRTTT